MACNKAKRAHACYLIQVRIVSRDCTFRWALPFTAPNFHAGSGKTYTIHGKCVQVMIVHEHCNCRLVQPMFPQCSDGCYTCPSLLPAGPPESDEASAVGQGLLPRTLDYMFASIGASEGSSAGAITYSCRASFLEVWSCVQRAHDFVM